MSLIPTITGKIEPAELGHTLMHEHVFSLYSDFRQQYGWDEDLWVESATAQLTALKHAGFETLVDMTVMGMGRYIPRLIPIARKSHLNIVAATGFYTFYDLPPYFRNATTYLDEHFVSKFLVRELTVGIGESDVLAAVIKLTTDKNGMTDEGAALVREVALAHHSTNALISTHTHADSEQGLIQQDHLAAAGVPLDRVLIGHSGDATDLGYLERLIERGSWLGMDRFGYGISGSLEQKIGVVAEMCARGYAERMTLSHDTSVTTDALHSDIRQKEEFDRWDYLCISDLVLPALRDRGVSENDIETMLVRNPAQLLQR